VITRNGDLENLNSSRVFSELGSLMLKTIVPSIPPTDTSRRRLLVRGVAIAGGALAAASGTFPAAATVKKMSQSAANYQPTPKGGARCDACALFQKPAACQTVAGVISPQGWCILFAAK
jgi:hypothetical protein